MDRLRAREATITTEATAWQRLLARAPADLAIVCRLGGDLDEAETEMRRLELGPRAPVVAELAEIQRGFGGT